MVNQPDSAAVKILFSKYWSPKGWITGTVSATDFEYAKRAEVMFDTADIDHASVLSRAIAVKTTITPAAVGDAFLASLSTRRLDWRSPLGSLSAIMHLRQHSFTPGYGVNPRWCTTCGSYLEQKQTDLNVLNFERLKWGGVRHQDPHYASLDIEWFSKLTPPTPVDEDADMLWAIVRAITRLPRFARPKHVEEAIKGIIPSNSSERRTLINILGYAGILIPKGRPTFWNGYPTVRERTAPPEKNDWRYPVVWWRGEDGVNSEALEFWFPKLYL